MNRELGAHFNLNQFKHYCTYNAHSGSMESWLVSLKSQVVRIDKANRDFHFDSMEGIHVEISFKYSLKQIENIANVSGFEIVQNFTDENNYFVDSLWRKK